MVVVRISDHDIPKEGKGGCGNIGACGIGDYGGWG